MDFQSPQNGMYDPSNFIDPNALANNQMNGTRQYPMSSIPQKRDSTGATLSRSQTPSQQPNFGFQQGFSHTPSPTMQNQNFRQGQMAPQRMQSPAQNPHAPQMSPMGFPQQGSPMPQGFDPNAAQYQGVQLSQNLQSRQQEAQRRYAMQLQAQAQQQQLGNLAASNMAAQQRHQAGQMPGVPGQPPGMQRNMMQGQMQNPQAQLQAFLKNVGALMAQHGRPFNPQPAVAGRAINLQQLYWAVMKMKGFRYVTSTNSWPRIAQVLGINYQQFPSAPEELRMTYETNLGLYETVYLAKQKSMQQNPMQPQMGGMGTQMSPTRPAVPGQPNPNAVQQEYLQQLQRSKALAAQQRQPDPAMQQPQQQPQQFDPALQQPPQQQFEHSTPVQNNVSLARVNGSSTPQADVKPPAGAMDHRKSASRQLEATPDRAPAPGVPTATPVKQQEDAPVEEKKPDHLKMIDDVLTFEPRSSVLNRHSGLDFQAENLVKRVEDLVNFKPNMPALMEMGVIDIRAITMSIRSGMHAEARLALDTLSKLTYEQTLTLELDRCEDLVEVLVDYADDQLDLLANDNPEVTDILDLTPYEDVIHNCRAEVSSLQEHPQFGTKEYDLERTADRLLAITTIFRNLSFLEINHTALTTSHVLKFFSSAIRLVGTRVLLLRTHVNTFDFMKDVVTFFSNTSTKIVLPSREDAYTILHFLCAFAPTPRPSTPVKFTPYNPKVHRYLPSAVDSLAKLLARDDPNRTYYKQIFVNEATSSPPYDLLTRAFALAIAVVPDRLFGKLQEASETRLTDVRMIEARIAEARKPYLMQGMLAADILASLAPGTESGICRSWLESEDGWAASLLKFAMNLCATDAQFPPPQQDHRMQGRNQRPMDHDVQGFQLIVHRALSMLKRLGEKSKGGDVLVKGAGAQTNGHAANHVEEEDDDDDDDMEDFEYGGSVWRVKADVLPKKETLLSALLTPSLDVRSLRQFCGIGYLDDMR
jgi:SWI/SNF chromatin-remodeling complex subunit SWI1